MKQLAQIFVLFFIIISCSNSKKTIAEGESTPVDSLNQVYNSVFKGVWVLTDYIKEIQKTGSPLKSANLLEGYVTLIIDQEVHGDSIVIGGSLNNHEGSLFVAYLNGAHKQNSLRTSISDCNVKSNHYEIGYEKMGKDIYLFLYHYSKTGALIDKRQFSKVLDKQTSGDAGWGLQFAVNKILITGKYTLIDSLNTKTKVEFRNDGSLVGFPDYKSFFINTDFMLGFKQDLDLIFLESQINQPKRFAFDRIKDTVNLYQTSGDEFEGKIKRGMLEYKLVKQ